MLDFTDAPYRFFPPAPSAPVIALCRWANRRFILPGANHRITGLTLSGATGPVAGLVRDPAARLLFVANHPSHSDPQILTETLRRLGSTASFMAAYDVFLRSRFNAWVMQRTGSFSVDREAADRKSMTAAGQVLAGGRFGLAIFPEGNVHFTNDRLSPIQDGAAFIATRTQKSLAANARVYAVPVSLKLTHLTDVRTPVRDTLASLANAAGDDLDPAAPPVDELHRIGRVLLARNLSQRGYLTRAEQEQLADHGSDLFEILQHSAARITSSLEQKTGTPTDKDGTLAGRIRRIRAAVHKVLSDPSRKIDHRSARHWADEALLVLRILGYGTPYVRESPTLDRFAETVEKLREDLHNRALPPFGPRHAYAHIGTPVDVAGLLGDDPKQARSATPSLTAQLQSAIQSGLDHTNGTLDTPGSRPF